MAKLRQSPWTFSGIMGDIVLCNGSKLRPYVRKRPSRKKNTPTAKQLETRLKMTKANLFLNTFRQVLGHCWKEQRGTMDPFYAATSQLIKHGMDVNGDEANFIYEQIWLSYGKLDRPVDPLFKLDNGKALVTWQNNNGLLGCRPNDEAIVAFYNENMQAGLVVREKASRGDCILLEILPKGFLNGKIHAFLFFLSRNEKSASPTTYVGFASNT